jgi:hypothetical protein
LKGTEDGFLPLAAEVGIKAEVQEFELRDADRAPALLKQGKIHGAAVLRISHFKALICLRAFPLPLPIMASIPSGLGERVGVRGSELSTLFRDD